MEAASGIPALPQSFSISDTLKTPNSGILDPASPIL